ncbi:MAG: hypothetical protein FWG98_01240 [Candidatus Cloacimonetes bacterium]|nr:hypothetical protein [Candidatus Cloacimonadota bacterium]
MKEKNKTIEKTFIHLLCALVPNKKWKRYIKKFFFIFVDSILNKKKIIPFIKHPICSNKRKKMRLYIEKTISSKKNPINIDHFDIPIYIIVYNQLNFLEIQINNLEKLGYHNIHFIDNASTYQPLLNYLQKTKHTVHRMDKNYGYKVFTNSGYFDDIIRKDYYVLSDPDIIFFRLLSQRFFVGFYENFTHISFY